MSETRETPRAPTWRVLGNGAALLIAGRIVAAACGLAQVPIALGHLGAERFGVWIALNGLLWTLTGLDGGIGYALQNRIARLVAAHQEPAAAGWIRFGFRRLWLVAGVIAIAGVLLIVLGSWPQWLGANRPDLAPEVVPAVAIAFGAAAVSVPLSLGLRLAAAAQQTWLTGLWTGLASIAGLLAVAGATALRLPLAGFMAASTLLPLATPVATWLHLRRRVPWLRQSGPPPGSAVRGLARESAAFFVPQVGAAFIGAFVPTLMAFFAGPAAAAVYGVLQRLFGLLLQLQSLSLQPVWPAYTHAAARGDAPAARAIYRASMLGALGIVVLVVLGVTPFTREILRVWLGAGVPEFSDALLWCVVAWHVAQFLGQPPATLLNGTGRAGVVAIASAGCVLSSLALCAWLGPRWGALGVVAALTAPYVLLNLPLVTWQAGRTLATMGKPLAVP